MPFPLSVTDERPPAVVAMATTEPPLVRLFPLASLAWTVMAEVLVPLATIEVGEAPMVELAAEAAPAVKVTVTELVIALPPIVPVTLAGPAEVEEVRVAL